jgi:hypothetical protein
MTSSSDLPTSDREVAQRLNEIADWFLRDRREPDKVMCHIASLRRVALDMALSATSSTTRAEGDGA